MKVITLNVNGIRASYKKGVWQWIEEQNPDILCLQEIRAHPTDVKDDILNPLQYVANYHFAEKKGYSCVGLYSKVQPKHVQVGFDQNINPEWEEFNREGRYVECHFNDDLVIISCYFPSGSSSELRQEAKFRFLKHMTPHLMDLKRLGKHILLCGDVNIAHTKQDIKNWRGNQKSSGFTPEERDWLTHLFAECDYRDVFRLLNQEDHQYSWWSNFGKAWENNAGWRIDYHIATPEFANLAESTFIYTDQRFSDHAPVVVEYNYKL